MQALWGWQGVGVDKASGAPAPGSLTATFLMHVTFVSSWDCILPSPPAWPGAGGACWNYHYLLAWASLAILGLATCRLKKQELSFFTLPWEPLEGILLITKIQSLLSLRTSLLRAQPGDSQGCGPGPLFIPRTPSFLSPFWQSFSLESLSTEKELQSQNKLESSPSLPTYSPVTRAQH